MLAALFQASLAESKWRKKVREMGNKEKARQEDIKELREKVGNKGKSLWNDHNFKGCNKPGVRAALISLINIASLHVIKSWSNAINVDLNKEQQKIISAV